MGFKKFRIICCSFILVLMLASSAFAETGSETAPLENLPMPLMRSSVSASSNYILMHDPLDGAHLAQSFVLSGYGIGYKNQAALFSNKYNYLRYQVPSQIPNSGAIQFYVYLAGSYLAPPNNINWIVTQAAFGGAYYGSIQLMLTQTHQLIYSQFLGTHWNYMYTQPAFS